MHIYLEAIICMFVKHRLLSDGEAKKLSEQFRMATFPDDFESMQRLIDSLYERCGIEAAVPEHVHESNSAPAKDWTETIEELKRQAGSNTSRIDELNGLVAKLDPKTTTLSAAETTPLPAASDSTPDPDPASSPKNGNGKKSK